MTPFLDHEQRLWLHSDSDPSVKVAVEETDPRYEELRSQARATRRKITAHLLSQAV